VESVLNLAAEKRKTLARKKRAGLRVTIQEEADGPVRHAGRKSIISAANCSTKLLDKLLDRLLDNLLDRLLPDG